MTNKHTFYSYIMTCPYMYGSSTCSRMSNGDLTNEYSFIASKDDPIYIRIIISFELLNRVNQMCKVVKIQGTYSDESLINTMVQIRPSSEVNTWSSLWVGPFQMHTVLSSDPVMIKLTSDFTYWIDVTLFVWPSRVWTQVIVS